jgi:hypothetical protein
MREMFLMPERIEDDLPAAPDLLLLALIDPVGVGYISKVPDPKTKHGHLHVPDMDRGKRDIADREHFPIDIMQFKLGDPGVPDIGKRIGEFPDDRFLGHGIGVKGHSPALKKVVGPDIVQTSQMILMWMRIDNRIEMTNACTEHLVTEIGSGVDHNGGGGRLDKDARTKAFIFGIGRSAHLAGTGYHGNTRAGAGTQEGNFDWRMAHGAKLRNKAG